MQKAHLWTADPALHFPLITKSGVNEQGKKVHYYFNYSAAPKTVSYPHKNGKELLFNTAVLENGVLNLAAWGVNIVEEN